MSEHAFTQSVSAKFPDLTNQVAIVTGASGGIGTGIAEFLGRQGMKLVLTSRREDVGQALIEQLRQRQIDCVWVSADIATHAGAQKVFNTAIEHFGQVDVLVNNAAMLQSRPFHQLDEDMYHQTFERNVRMVVELSRVVVAHWLDTQHPGNIIHVSSVGGLRAHRGLAGYDASKGAIDSLTRSMAVDLGAHGIRVNAVAPGNTPKDGPRPLEGVPLGRSGSAEDVAALIAFLASDAGAYITGQVIYVDGGLTTQLTPPGIFI